MMLNLILNTNGNGYWTKKKKAVKATRLEVITSGYYDGKISGELRVYFSKDSWNVNNDGLIYTDPLWINDLRSELILNGFTRAAVNDISYSEQGMQGQTYVSLDAGEIFIREFYSDGFHRILTEFNEDMDA